MKPPSLPFGALSETSPLINGLFAGPGPDVRVPLRMNYENPRDPFAFPPLALSSAQKKIQEFLFFFGFVTKQEGITGLGIRLPHTR